MLLDLTGKVILITGAANGIGRAIATQAAAAGATLVLTDRDASLDRIAADLVATAHIADLLDPAAPRQITDATLGLHGRIDALVNAAGLTSRATFLTATPALWDQLFTINARAPFFLMQAVLADMLARKSPGTILNILSMNAPCGIPELAVYSGTKGALATLTRNAANAHMADRIRVNGINLGWVATETEHHMQADILGRGADWQAQAAATLPLGRLVTAEEAANLATYLLSDASIPMSGAVIDLDQKVAGAP